MSPLLLDFVMKVSKKYLQTLLEDCKYDIKENETKNLINDDLNLSFWGDEYDDRSNDKSSNNSDD